MTSLPVAPKRIQRQRTKGWRMPEGAIYVGRPTVWGNPFDLERPYSMPSGWRKLHPSEAVALFRIYAEECGPFWRQRLAGHDLACWCALDQPCHADVLLELANR